MNPLLKSLLHPYMAPLDEGNDTGGGAPVDRGDTLSESDGEAQESDKHDDQIDDFFGEKGAEKDADNTDEQPRDKDGKFAKRERPVPDHVPRERMDEAVTKERQAREAAERRAEELASRLQQEEKSADVQKLEDQVEELTKAHSKYLMDGETEKAVEAMRAIRQTERQIARMETEETSSRATAAAVEQVRMESTIASLEAAYPAFNPDSESFDQDLVDFVIGEQSRLMQSDRMSPSKALQVAAAKIMKKFGPREDAIDGKGLAAAKGSDRKKEQVERNLDTARRQPASMKESGKDSDKAGEHKIDVSALTKDEFDALPDSTKRRLRGDDA